MFESPPQELELQILLRHTVRQWLVRLAALQYGRTDDPRRAEWTSQADRYRQQLHEIISTHWELDPELDQLKQAEWPQAREIAFRLIEERP
jgi:hypothetical protein